MSIDYTEFVKGCRELVDHHVLLNDGGGWKNVGLRENFGAEYLSVESTVQQNTIASLGLATLIADDINAAATTTGNDESELDEIDDENLLYIEPASVRGSDAPTNEDVTIVYDIVHSPTYQVPALYLRFKGLKSRDGGLPALDEVYRALVPGLVEGQMRDVGVIGALSVTEHPMTGLPAYFVHPCRTQEAMTAVGAGSDGEPVEYLTRWFGLIGGSVGLKVPVQLAASLLGGGGGSEGLKRSGEELRNG